MDPEQQAAWINRAHNRWIEDGGRTDLRAAIVATAPTHATEDEQTEALALCIAFCQSIYEGIMDSYADKEKTSAT